MQNPDDSSAGKNDLFGRTSLKGSDAPKSPWAPRANDRNSGWLSDTVREVERGLPKAPSASPSPIPDMAPFADAAPRESQVYGHTERTDPSRSEETPLRSGGFWGKPGSNLRLRQPADAATGGDSLRAGRGGYGR